MAQTRIKLKQVHYTSEEWEERQTNSLFIPDITRSTKIIYLEDTSEKPKTLDGLPLIKYRKEEVLLPDERLDGKVDQPQIFGGRKVTKGSLQDIWENLDEYTEALPKKQFKVLDFDDSEIGMADSMDKAVELFLEIHPHFDKESIKTFIYETD
jgi:hypothetical protein